jgi:polysaccharide export outer membrane protein
MTKRTQMTHKSFHAWISAAVLLIFFAEAGVAQGGMQQMSGSQNRAASSGNRSGTTAARGSSGLTVVPEDFVKLRLAPGFMVSLDVLDDPDFTGTFRVDQQGDIALPILGTIYVAGKTVSEARVQIHDRLLKDQILNDPQVNLTVLEYTAPEVTIIGEVTSPGKYPLLAPRKLLDVLALAGGTTLSAGNEVQITRGSEDTEPVLLQYSRSTNPKVVETAIVRPGDTVLVKRAGIVYVLGAVNRPGGFVMQEEGSLNVLQAIALADGTAITAAKATIHLLRRNADGTVIDIAVPYDKISRGKIADVQLHATDVLYVPTSKIKAIFTSTQTIMNSAATSAIYKF